MFFSSLCTQTSMFFFQKNPNIHKTIRRNEIRPISNEGMQVQSCISPSSLLVCHALCESTGDQITQSPGVLSVTICLVSEVWKHMVQQPCITYIDTRYRYSKVWNHMIQQPSITYIDTRYISLPQVLLQSFRGGVPTLQYVRANPVRSDASNRLGKWASVWYNTRLQTVHMLRKLQWEGLRCNPHNFR